MNNNSNDEKDLYIKEKLNNDNLISKKYDDMFENFLKGEHEMKEDRKEEIKNQTKETKKIVLFKPLTAIAACALIFVGANVYAITQGYDNIFFLIKDLRNKDISSVVIEDKKDLINETDTTISYTRIDICEGFDIQIPKFVVKEGKAKLYYSLNETLNAKVVPYKFIVTSNGTELANQVINTNTPYIELNDSYKEDMKILDLKIEDKTGKELVTISIDLENKEIKLVNNENIIDSAEEVKKVSESDLKEKLGDYTVLTSPYKIDEEFRLFEVGLNLVAKADNDNNGNAAFLDKNGFWSYKREAINDALKEANLTELGKNISSEMFTYDADIDAYKFIEAGDGSYTGLVLSIDDLKYINGKYTVIFTYCYPTEQDFYEGDNVEKLDRYQGTFTFTLNGDNAKYTKYKLEEKEFKKIEKNNDVTDTNVTDTNVTDTNVTDTNVTNTNVTNTNENTNSSNTNDSKIVEKIDDIDEKPVYDASKVNNYASTMEWTQHTVDNIKFEFPTAWSYRELARNLAMGTERVRGSGWAIGINPDTKEIIETKVGFILYEGEVVEANSVEDAYKKFAEEWFLTKIGEGYTNNNGDQWRHYGHEEFGNGFYVNVRSLTKEGENKYLVSYLSLGANNDDNSNFKVTNICTNIIGSLEVIAE